LEEVNTEPVFAWECTEFTAKGIGFKMGFKNPLEVSSNNGKPDKLVLQLKKNTFYAAGTGEPLTGKLSLNIDLPKQFPSAFEKALTEAVADSAKTILTTYMSIGATGQFFFVQILKKMWPLYNCL
jgi:hypothetical protein